MTFEVRDATASDIRAIKDIYRNLHRPPRKVIRGHEFVVASMSGAIIGCAGLREFLGGGYLFGLAVRREFQRQGVGSALTQAHLARIQSETGALMVALVMFWNLPFFRRLGFELTKRAALPPPVARLSDFKDPLYVRSAVVCRRLPAAEA